jgi:2,3-bisphosphoglycerate-dependent phosphoglycerate mutase
MPTLVLLRHGLSQWNLEDRFTGWVDVDLAAQGEREARQSGELIAAADLQLDRCFASVLTRAIRTADLALAVAGQLWIPLQKDWRLNERHYGGLTGLNKAETAAQHGEEQVKVWRRSYDVPPPPVDPASQYHPANDERYRWLPADVLPATECLKDVVARMLPYWYDAIVPDLRAGHTVLVAAHGNSLRALVKHLDGMTDDEVVELNIPTGVPRVYDLDADLRPVGWRYLGDPEAIARKAEAVARQGAAQGG